MKSNLELNMPIYLDTNLLLDLLASIDDGFSSAKKITTDKVESQNSYNRGNIGFSAYLFDFGINLSKDSSDTQGKTSEVEKYHTYGSMMNKLIGYLDEHDLIKKLNDEESEEILKIYDFVELQGKFIPNPLPDSFKKIYNFMELAKTFSSFDQNQNLENDTDNSNKSGGKNKKKKDKKSKPTNNTKDSFDDLIDLLKSLSESFERENSQKFIIETDLGLNCILNLFNDYIRDNSGLELPYGNFKVLGKIIRIENNINLLEDTPYSLSDEIISGLQIALKSIDEINLPEIKTEIDGKCIQIIPIAVYV